MNLISRIFAFVGGSNPSILARCSAATQTKRTMQGVLLFVVQLMSSVALAVGLSTATSPVFGICAGILWMGIMITLDGLFLSSQSPFLLRLLLALLMGFVNSELLLTIIFNEEVKEVVMAERKIEIDSIESTKIRKQDKFDFWYESERNRIDAGRDSIDARTARLIGEIQGRVGSGKEGYGPAAKSQKEQITTDSTRLAKDEEYFLQNAAKKDTLLQAEKRSLTGQQEKLRNKKHGLLERMLALWPLRAKDWSLWIWTAVVIILEVAVFIVKKLGGKDDYDTFVDREIEENNLVTNSNFLARKEEASGEDAQREEGIAQNQLRISKAQADAIRAREEERKAELEAYQKRAEQLQKMVEDKILTVKQKDASLKKEFPTV